MPLTIRIICIGKLKERFYEDASAEFLKRLSRYADVEIIELPDEKAPENLSEASRGKLRELESGRILANVRDGETLIALDIRGKAATSEKFAGIIGEYMVSGRSRLCFAIGGSLGLGESLLARADLRLSFGMMTFSHQIFRIMLLEQIYRAFRIINNEPYHK